MMSAEDCKAIANRWMNAFNAHDIIELLNLYDENAVHYSPKLLERKPETKGLIKGKPELYAWWKDAFERLPTLSYKPTKFIAEADCIFMEYIRSVEGEKDLKVGEVLEIKNNRIIASRVYHG